MSDSTAEDVRGRVTGQLWIAAVPAALVVVVTFVVGRGLWFFSDDWNILAGYHSGGLLEPFNGHLSMVPAGIYRVLFHTVGVGSYLPYRLVGLAALAVLGFQIARVAVHRLQGAGPVVPAVAGFLAVGAVLWNSAGQMNLMFPFLMNFTIPIAALAAIWWHLDRGSLRGEVAASVWLAVALGTSGLGVMTAGAVGVELLVGRAPLRRWLVLAPGPLLWAAWFLTHREANEVTTDVSAVASYTARMLFAAASSVTAGWAPGGALVVLALGAYLVLASLRWRSVHARALGALSAPVVFALFTAVTRIGIVPEIPPDELRYSWAIVAYTVLAVLVVARPEPLLEGVPRPVWIGVTGVALAVLLVGAVGLVQDLRAWNQQVERARPGLSAVLFAVESIGPDRIDRDRVIPLSYVPVTTGGYLGAVEAVGSPIAGDDPRGFGGAEDLRSTADHLFVEELPVSAAPGDPSTCEGSTPVPSSEALPTSGAPPSSGAQGDATGSMDTMSAFEVADGSTVLVGPFDAAGDGGTVGVPPAELPLARFTPPGPTPMVPAGSEYVQLTIPADRSDVRRGGERPYRLELPVGVRVLRCG